jgi:hypothetical protein
VSDFEQRARLILDKLAEPGQVALELGPTSRELVGWMAERSWVTFEETTNGVLLVRTGPVAPPPPAPVPTPAPPVESGPDWSAVESFEEPQALAPLLTAAAAPAPAPMPAVGPVRMEAFPKVADQLARESKSQFGPIAIGVVVALIALALLYPMWRSGNLLKQHTDDPGLDAGSLTP